MRVRVRWPTWSRDERSRKQELERTTQQYYVASLGGCWARCSRCLMDVAIESVRMSETICWNLWKACERGDKREIGRGNKQPSLSSNVTHTRIGE